MAVLRLLGKIQEMQEVSMIDRDIRGYIDQYPQGDYTDAISDDNRFEVFYHLSDLRIGLFAWYDFNPEASLLEIGAGFGALTGGFCRQCAHVTAVESSKFRAESLCQRHAWAENLTVCAGHWQDLPCSETFDYIVLAGGLETAFSGDTGIDACYADYLRGLQRYLKPNGILLLAVINRYGLRYFCGEKEPYANRPFAGIQGDFRGTGGRSFAKNELEAILRSAGAEHWRFYYPLPDYKLPQLIYTDDYLPEKNVRERLIPYYRDAGTLVAFENDLYDDIIDNHVFPFFANSYLVEVGVPERFSAAVYAALSTDRGRDRAFATVIYRKNRVCKKPIYSAGIPYARQLLAHLDVLSARGIPVVQHAWDGQGICMPQIHAAMLSNYIKEIVRDHPAKFWEILDDLWRMILQSSEYAEAVDNALQQGKPDLSWGPILKKAYLELIPLNCFYQDGKFLFFDQEYVRDNYPAKYVLFRAIHYIYGFTPQIDHYIPLEKVKKKYELEELWDIFSNEEDNRFLPEVRQHQRYCQFYRWTKIDAAQLKRNALLLGLDEECSPAYRVSARMQRIWKVQFDLLRVFTALCTKYHLRYFMIYGTLLGAVRHENFIPWDDDVDVALPREDYNKLIEAAQKELSDPYFLQTPENDPDCFYGGFIRLRNSNTTGISAVDFGHHCNLGIWMDIFPLDTCMSDKKIVDKKMKRIRFWQRLLFAEIYENPRRIKTPWYKSKDWLLAKIFGHAALCRHLQQAILADTQQPSDYVAIFTHYDGAKIFEKNLFDDAILLKFGEMRLCAPKKYQRCLELSMGRDYMKYPPLARRKPHHPGIFNPDLPYRQYNNLFGDMFDGAQGRYIILFGAGFMFEEYMKKYGRAYPPAFLVDNDPKKWGTVRQNIDIKRPQDILRIAASKRHVIICSIYYREIEKQLHEMGVREYKVYVQDKQWILDDEQRGR